MAITVPHTPLARGYSIEGERGGSPKAIVPYLVAWADAFNFYNQVLGIVVTALPGSPISYTLAHQFPPSPNLYAVRARIEPIGAGGGTPPYPDLGLKPGEYFTYAKVTVEYEVPPYIMQPGDDPFGANQLDPADPLTLCDQEVDVGGKMVTIESAKLKFSDITEPITKPAALVQPESRLVLSFPRVPYLPWQLIQSFVGSVNDHTLLQCNKGTLLFEGAKTKMVSTTSGTRGQNIQLMFSFQNDDWNLGIAHDGSKHFIQYNNGNYLYPYKDFTPLFLTYNETSV